ncbi:hypothetical protein PS15p_209433 [Mucor circinelloides]
METLFNSIKPATQQYTKMSFKDKMPFFLTANSIINLSSSSTHQSLDKRSWLK